MGTPWDVDAFVRSSILAAHLECLPAERREPFAAAMTANVRVQLDYVRLNVSARCLDERTSGRAGRVAPVPAYVIYQGEVLDADRYEEYKPLAAASVEAAGGRYLARGGETAALEGDPPVGRTVLFEFPTMDAAVAWYEGQQYSDARKVREGAANARVFVVDGVA